MFYAATLRQNWRFQLNRTEVGELTDLLSVYTHMNGLFYADTNTMMTNECYCTLF